MPGFYKIFLALDVGEDYHWWRQDNNKYWSHKPGSTNVINLDASGNKIIEPFDGIRKNNSLLIFKILLIIIIVDVAIDCFS